MAVFKIHHNDNYTVVSNSLVRDTNLSLKGKGLMLVILSLPDTWEFSINGMKEITKEGYDAVESGFKELETLGYLKRTRIKNKGKYTDVQYDFYETPQVEKPQVEKPPVENHRQLNKDILNIDILNKDRSSTNTKIVDTNTKNYKETCNYINNLQYSNEFKDYLLKWYSSVGKGRISLECLKDKINVLISECNNDLTVAAGQIKNSYLNNYISFYPPRKFESKKTTYKPDDNIISSRREFDNVNINEYVCF